jgi:tetraacyldisaccharide 4'-kinase
MKQLLALFFLVGRIFSPVYSLAMVLRAFLYRKNLFLRSRRLPIPVISIGNLTMGGTGKTPMVRYVSRLLLGMGFRPAIVSRGYGGKAANKVNIVSDGTTMLLSPDMAGDEPFMLGEALPGVPVLTGRERARAATRAISEFGVDYIVMDDGFQHLAVQRDLDLVLFSGRTLLGDGRVFPGGVLREPVSALGRAHAFVVTGVDCDNRERAENFQRWLRKIFPEKPVFTGKYLPAGIWHSKKDKDCSLAEAREMPVFAFAGIANPDSFRQTLLQERFFLAGFKEFKDHHRYTAQEVADLVAEALKKEARALVTTEKDFVKLRPFLGEFPVLALIIELRMDQDFDLFMAERFGKGAR